MDGLNEEENIEIWYGAWYYALSCLREQKKIISKMNVSQNNNNII